MSSSYFGISHSIGILQNIKLLWPKDLTLRYNTFSSLGLLQDKKNEKEILQKISENYKVTLFVIDLDYTKLEQRELLIGLPWGKDFPPVAFITKTWVPIETRTHVNALTNNYSIQELINNILEI
ncbi:MAG TPA: hypothetical protein VFQ59_03345 [Candidatus Paceibacterota bacterium]|nr:hypothetical protein [Candidatus Paceibacterota bacterium]